MKTCNKCGETKDLSEFFRNKGMPDGLLKQCKKCVTERTKLYRKTPNGIAARKNEKQYPEAKKRYKQTEKGKLAQSRYNKKRYQQYKKEKAFAHMAVRNALLSGKLIAQPCWICGEKAEAHHSSYSQDMTLAVTWLCRQHHNQVHIEYKNYKSWS